MPAARTSENTLWMSLWSKYLQNVESNNGKKRFIDRNGNFLLNEDYTPLGYCTGGVIPAEWTEKGKRVKGFVSPDGKQR